MNKKQMIYEYGNATIASKHLSNSSGVTIHHIDDWNGKVLVSIVSSDRIISTHYVKLHHNGSFRINKLYFNVCDFIRSRF